jgi:hypothetical protein
MLVMDVRGLSGDDRAYARFWNHLHSIESALAGVKLGLWLRNGSKIPSVSSNDGVLVELGWSTGGDGFESTRRRFGPEALAAFAWETVLAVALARFELPDWVHSLLVERVGYSPTIPGQVSGWWTEDTQLPGYRPGGALLPEGDALADGCECIVLVDVDDWWGVLSPLALGAYSFGIQLEAGETVAFLDENGRRWAVRRIADADLDEVRARWGGQVAGRARAGLPIVRVSVSSVN